MILLKESAYNLHRNLAIDREVCISHLSFLLIQLQWTALVKDEINHVQNHILFQTILHLEFAFLKKVQPELEILIKSSPILGYLILEH